MTCTVGSYLVDAERPTFKETDGPSVPQRFMAGVASGSADRYSGLTKP